MELGCGFVARCFSGDPKQLNTILKAALAHRGTAIIDVISPCVTFNNHESSTKSYKNAKDRDFPLQELGFVPYYDLEQVEVAPGERKDVRFPDGSRLTFRAIREDYDPQDRFGAMKAVHEAHLKGEFLTGILYIRMETPTLHDFMHVVDEPLVHLPESAVKPGPEVLAACMEELM
jgi:2-oxoglutarate ferredoxin oxidoreductase subunit beta